jgi:hypothetical protein
MFLLNFSKELICANQVAGNAFRKRKQNSQGLRLRSKPSFIACLAAAGLLCSAASAQANDWEIDQNVSRHVYGNAKEDPLKSKAINFEGPNGNTVVIKANVSGEVYGASYGFIGGAASGSGMVSGAMEVKEAGNNQVHLASGAAWRLVGSSVYEDQGVARSSGNQVLVSSGLVGADGVTGGNAASPFGTASSDSNVVLVSGGKISGNIQGGNAVSSAADSQAYATYNTIVVSGGELEGDITGGYANNTKGAATATHNRVMLTGMPTLPASKLYGGFAQGANSDAFTGNTLNVGDYRGSSVAGVQGFEFYDFVLQGEAKPIAFAQTPPKGFEHYGFVLQGKPHMPPAALKVSGKVDFSDPGSGRSATVLGVGFAEGSPVPKAGDRFVLIQADGGFTGTLANNGGTLCSQRGVALSICGTVDQSGNEVSYGISGLHATPGAKALSEGFLGGVALLVAGSDFVDSQVLPMSPMSMGVQGRKDWHAFGKVGGGDVRHKSGSSIGLRNWNLLLGLAGEPEAQGGKLSLAAFAEYSRGNYDARNSLAEGGKNSGGVHYYGLGVLAKMQHAGGWHTEAGVRLGRIRNHFDAKGLKDANGVRADYAAGGNWAGVHVGVGRLRQLGGGSNLDIYAKFFYLRAGGDKVRADTGDRVEFDGVDSERLRLGARFTHAIDAQRSLYAGLAYEHEFDGKAKAKAYGARIKAPSLQGGTGIGEFGVQFKPSAGSALTLDAGIQGYAGKREGVAGSLQANWAF